MQSSLEISSSPLGKKRQLEAAFRNSAAKLNFHYFNDFTVYVSRRFSSNPHYTLNSDIEEYCTAWFGC
jgi:hypothetical protein